MRAIIQDAYGVPGEVLRLGDVEKPPVGRGVTTARVGDQVFGWCSGAFCEYVAVPEGRLTAKPANLTQHQAAAVPIAGSTALRRRRPRSRGSARTTCSATRPDR